jgi:hypothetical protein
MYTSYAYTTNTRSRGDSGDGVTWTVWPLTAQAHLGQVTLGPYDMVANPGTARQFCSYCLE